MRVAKPFVSYLGYGCARRELRSPNCGPKGASHACGNAGVTHPNTFVIFSSILKAIEFLSAKKNDLPTSISTQYDFRTVHLAK